MKCLNKGCKDFDLTEINNCSNMYNISACSAKELVGICEYIVVDMYNDEIEYSTGCIENYTHNKENNNDPVYCTYCGKKIKIN
jgi:hypothetical protein